MSKEIDINNEEQILKECDFDYYYDSVCSRELCMFFNDIARQDSHFDKLQAYIDLGRIGITINKLFRENTDLEAKLAESEKSNEYFADRVEKADKEIKEIYKDYNVLVEEYNELKQQLAEKEKEIERLNLEFETQEDWQEKWQKLYDETCNLNHDKISFAVEQLEKVKEKLNELFENEHGCAVITDVLNNQIKELKKEMK